MSSVFLYSVLSIIKTALCPCTVYYNLHRVKRLSATGYFISVPSHSVFHWFHWFFPSGVLADTVIHNLPAPLYARSKIVQVTNAAVGHLRTSVVSAAATIQYSWKDILLLVPLFFPSFFQFSSDSLLDQRFCTRDGKYLIFREECG